MAQGSPEDPEYLPPVGPQTYQPFPTTRSETATAGPDERLTHARQGIELCQSDGIQAAGLVASSVETVGVATNTGLFAFEERTEAHFSLTAQGNGTTGWSAGAHRSLDHLQVKEWTRVAIEKAKRSQDPQELPAGRYTVILETPAVAGILNWVTGMLDAKSYNKGTSPFSGKLAKAIVDPRLTLRNQPEHADLLGIGFTREGLPVEASTWIDRGVLRQLSYDRFTAQQQGLGHIPTLVAPCLSGEGEQAATIEDLIHSTQHGILVTNFWYIRPVNLTDLTLTGMTRDGTFLIEDGQITTAVRNFRFHDSPLRAFNQVEAFTTPKEAITSETGKVLVPSMKIRDFNFSSVTRF
jgi:predicted Zn-dependent protease